jgi:tRNA dimethylallyltransferase
VQKEDPAFYHEGEIHNPARLLRALSFVRSAGASITRYKTGKKKVRPFEILKVGLELSREELYGRINKRVDGMMAAGLLDEAKQLFHLRHLKNLQTVGYSELFDYLEGKCTLSAAVDKIKQHTRNYAKRQMTWFRKDEGINWLHAGNTDIVEKILLL